MQIVGQDNILDEFKKYTYQTLPHTLMIIGEKGSGRHLIAEELGKIFEMEVKDITESITFEFLEDLKLNVFPSFYEIDYDKLTDRGQADILKFLEEPNITTYIILIIDNIENVLETIRSRCFPIRLNKYSPEILKQFIDDADSELLDYCNTPGQVIAWKDQNIGDIKKLIITIIEKIKGAAISNIFVISDKINFKDDLSKYDLTLFLRIFKTELLKYLANCNAETYIEVYKKILNLEKQISKRSCEKERLFNQFLIEVKYII